jgi:hypothetical protein
MNRLKPVVAKMPGELARALGLPAVVARQWQVQHVLLKRRKEIARRQHPGIAGIPGESLGGPIRDCGLMRRCPGHHL